MMGRKAATGWRTGKVYRYCMSTEETREKSGGPDSMLAIGSWEIAGQEQYSHHHSRIH